MTFPEGYSGKPGNTLMPRRARRSGRRRGGRLGGRLLLLCVGIQSQLSAVIIGPSIMMRDGKTVVDSTRPFDTDMKDPYADQLVLQQLKVLLQRGILCNQSRAAGCLGAERCSLWQARSGWLRDKARASGCVAGKPWLLPECGCCLLSGRNAKLIEVCPFKGFERSEERSQIGYVHIANIMLGRAAIERIGRIFH